jgi:hypothetical protein
VKGDNIYMLGKGGEGGEEKNPRGEVGGGFFCHYLNLGKKEIKHWGRRF